MTRIGIMQGRLLPPEAGRFQSFPLTRWTAEFDYAAQVPLSYIEWIYDLYGAAVNPLTNHIEALEIISAGSRVAVRSLCADYFMDRPFLRCSPAELCQRENLLHELLRLSATVGIDHLVLPFVDASKIVTAEDRNTVVDVLKRVLPAARQAGVGLHLETCLAPADFARLLDRIPDSLVKVTYDSGNSSSLGYAPAAEFSAYGARVGSVHIKDRILGGGTVPLGTGDADFPAVFNALAKVGYEGDITLQVARSEAGNEVEWARINRAFVAAYWPLG